MDNSNTNNMNINPAVVAQQLLQQLQQQRSQNATNHQLLQQMSNNTHQNNYNNTITHQNNPNNFNTHQNNQNNTNLYQNNSNTPQNNTPQVQLQQLRSMCPTPMISVPTMGMGMINPMSMYSIVPHQQYGTTVVGTSPPGTAATAVVQEVQPSSLPVQGQPPVQMAAPTETITGHGQDPSSVNSKKRAAADTTSEDDAAAVDDTGGTGIGDKERDMSQDQEPASKKTKPDSTTEEGNPTVVTPTKKQEVPSSEEILRMQCPQLRSMLVELGMDGGEDAVKRAKLETEMKKKNQPELFLLLLSKLHSGENVIFFKKSSTTGLGVCADKLREGKMVVREVFAVNYHSLGCKVRVGDELSFFATDNSYGGNKDEMNQTLLNLFHDNHNGSGKASQHLLIKVIPSHSTSAKGGGNTATSNTTREDIMSKASTLAQNQRSAAAAEKSAVDSTDTLIPEKSVDSTNVSTVTTRAGKKAADAATAKQDDAAASISEKSATKEVVDSTAVEQVATAVVPSIRGAAFERAKELNAKAKSERTKRIDVAVNSVLGSISNTVAAGILECFNASVSEAKENVQEKVGAEEKYLNRQINTFKQTLALKNIGSEFREQAEKHLESAVSGLENLDAKIVQIKKDELAQLKKNYTELFKDAMMYHNKLGMYKMDQSEVVKLKKEWEENLAKTTWEHL